MCYSNQEFNINNVLGLLGTVFIVIAASIISYVALSRREIKDGLDVVLATFPRG